MGKNHRHKKKVKSEKSKTQLKTKTKFLPKGLNVTKTEFKIRPIVLPSQLESKVTQDGQRNLDLKDILSRLKHYNENMQIKACEDMDYLIKHERDKLTGGNIPSVIQNLAEFIQMKMPKARKAGLNVINTFLHSFALPQITPYFHYFSVNLRCAMTHIDRNIQEDSILFLDSFLTIVPSLMAKYSNDILPDFLMLISKLKNDANFKRTVTVNLKSKFTSIGWRIVVFSRLYVFLKAILSEDTNSANMKMDEEIVSVTYDANSFCEKGIFKSCYALTNPTNFCNGLLIHKVKDDSNDRYSILIPLLLETWLEGAPTKQTTKGTTHLSEETAMLLNCVVKVFYLIWSHLKVHGQKFEDAITSEAEKFIKNLVKNLPYNLINRPKQQEKKDKFLNLFITQDVKCSQENLLICYLYFISHSRNPSKCKAAEIESILSFLTGCLLKDYKEVNTDMNNLYKVLQHLLVEKPLLWDRNKVDVHKILINTTILYDRGNLDKNNQFKLLKLLASIDFEPFIRNESYVSWLINVPNILKKESVHQDVVDSMFDMCRKNKIPFIESLAAESPKIIENLPKLTIVNAVDAEKSKLKIIDMLFYAPPLTLNHLNEKSQVRISPYLNHLQYVFEMRRKFGRELHITDEN